MTTDMTAATLRLAQSRLRLQKALLSAHHQGPPGTPGAASSGGGLQWTDLLKMLPSPPWLKTVLQLLRSPQPLHSAGALVNQTALIALHPLAQRSPWTLVLGAAVVGGVLVKTQAWRWLLTTVLMHAVVPSLTSTIVSRRDVKR
jgi:hypothetical protein